MNDFETLTQLKSAKAMGNYIDYVRFPRYKNLENGTKIDFNYPITALVGANGTNKSSILRALQACPNQYDIGDYWFDTPLDRIDQGSSASEGPNRYIHAYLTPSGKQVEVIKARVGKTARGADYFETSTPRIRDKMSPMPNDTEIGDEPFRGKTRWTPIDKKVVYLDFRQELPAYDIKFHFNWRNQDNDVASKKKQIRQGGPHVNRALLNLGESHVYYGKNRILEPADELNIQELSAISSILGRKYSSIRLVKHDYFGVEGYTAKMVVGGQTYSEAYAGSGEFATIMLVKAISRAPTNSLILLDEPETSLHPGAQKFLMDFIAKQCVKYKHQVVLATHSPAMVESLPSTARKLLDLDQRSGRVRLISNSASLGESFTRLGATFARSAILVEDKLAREIVLRAARIKGFDYVNSLDVQFIPGGVDSIIQRVAPTQAQLNVPCSILLDGDARPQIKMQESADVTDDNLLDELEKIGLKDVHLFRDGGNDQSIERRIRGRRQTLNWINKHLGFLPGFGNPEQLLMELIGAGETDGFGAKKYWRNKCHDELGLLPSEGPSSGDIFNTQRRALADIEDNNWALKEILEKLESMMNPLP